jgi:predicted RNA-binding Zn-ribbon protein involved in translation (DUF1610 family)
MSNKPTSTKASSIAISYYSRPEIQQAIFDFCQNRETVPNFNNCYFGKRPDALDYPSDISNLAKKGATSFHCSEEIWNDPLKIDTNMTPDQYNQIKTGWDLLLDIDSPYLDYGKIAAKQLIKELNNHGIKNIGIKFSGSKGFHIIIPFAAFPQELEGKKTKDNFPDFPRAIAAYLFHKIKNPMNNEILKLSGREKLLEQGELISEHSCPKCGEPTIKKSFHTYTCPNPKCKSTIQSTIKKKVDMLCPSCNTKMNLTYSTQEDFCENCKISTAKFKATNSNEKFKEEITIHSTKDAIDVVLVSPRHLFRAPYSLHEKTALASVPLTIDQIDDFKMPDAEPDKIKQTKNYLPNSTPNEAKYLLTQALKFQEKTKPYEPEKKEYTGESINLKGLKITEDLYPPVIKNLLNGTKRDGRKRTLSLLLAFLTSLELDPSYIETTIQKWNKKNYAPLPESYIRGQLNWSKQNKRLPPNYDKPIYKELDLKFKAPTNHKNPVPQTIKSAFQARRSPKEDFYKKPKKYKGEI